MSTNRIHVTDGPNPAVLPGETLTRLPGGDYQLSNDEHCWVFTPAEWVEYATDFVDHLKASEFLRYVFMRMAEGIEDPNEVAALLADVEMRADRTEEGLKNAVSMWSNRVKYIDFLAETMGPLPAMPEGWEPQEVREARAAWDSPIVSNEWEV